MYCTVYHLGGCCLVREVWRHLGSPGLHRANALKIYLWAEGGRKVTWRVTCIVILQNVSIRVVYSSPTGTPTYFLGAESLATHFALEWSDRSFSRAIRRDAGQVRTLICAPELHVQHRWLASWLSNLSLFSGRGLILVVARPKRVSSDSIKFKGQG